MSYNRILDINLVDNYIRLRKNFDYARFRGNMNVVKNVSGLDNCFYHT